MKTLITRLFAATAVFAISAANVAAAASALREHEEINRGLVVIAAGDMIQENCATISPRMIKAFAFAQSLQSLARKDGFSDDEIDAFVRDKVEKNRVKGLALDYLVANGVKPDQPATYCTVGLYEIERNSQIGVLLKAK
jgi:ABC-type sugar transport system substrate-binding protein